MSFNYEPLTEEEANKSRYTLVEEGDYNFEVLNVEDMLSKKTLKPMIKLTMQSWNTQGEEFTIIDYLVADPKMQWKIRNFCKSTGLINEYEQKNFNSSVCLRKTGTFHLKYQQGGAKPEGGYYPDKNNVSDYILKDGVSTSYNKSVQKTSNPENIDDDVPF
jgi:hypothetical protein